jgi:hypothetical protein
MQCEQQHAGRWLIKPMYGIDSLSDLVSHYLQGKTCFPPIHFASMNQQTTGFIDNDEVSSKLN